jgi:hypothetical protein
MTEEVKINFNSIPQSETASIITNQSNVIFLSCSKYTHDYTVPVKFGRIAQLQCPNKVKHRLYYVREYVSLLVCSKTNANLCTFLIQLNSMYSRLGCICSSRQRAVLRMIQSTGMCSTISGFIISHLFSDD